MSPIPIFIGVAVSGIVFMAAQRRKAVRLEVATKPIPMLLLIVGIYLCGEARQEMQRTLVALGLAASLAGDVFLVLPRERFVAGLASFLLAHLLYVAAFLYGIPPSAWTPALPYAAGYLVVAGILFAILYPRLGNLLIPVVLYVLAICAMCAAACVRGIADGSLLAPLGATMFFFSDAILAYDRFRRRFAAAKPVLYTLYGAGQALITASVWV